MVTYGSGVTRSSIVSPGLTAAPPRAGSSFRRPGAPGAAVAGRAECRCRPEGSLSGCRCRGWLPSQRLPHLGPGAGADPAHSGSLTSWVQVPVQTLSPRWFSDTVANEYSVVPLRSLTFSSEAVVVISSPATTAGPQTNSWPAWTIIAKLIPTSGSKIACATARRL